MAARFYSRESAFDPMLELTCRGPLPPLDPPTPGASAVVMAAGDLVRPPGTTVTVATCKHQEGHDVVVTANPDRFIALGDLAHGLGSGAEFIAPGRYSDTFGDLRNIALPVVGNHEGFTAGARGYFDFWYGAGVGSGAFRRPTQRLQHHHHRQLACRRKAGAVGHRDPDVHRRHRRASQYAFTAHGVG